ncbi:hypothetical protein KIPB_002742 [Kipferlia bialata]|uniref:Uncharacterized protein n=1 Tax=Kipferlia bialata TaxID=797122 RepID=A0A9K3GF65_9EUKA|nr:hypothetical protein KIPB_002742 [Kipferlia bialata]|eukprot:g2742.t1
MEPIPHEGCPLCRTTIAVADLKPTVIEGKLADGTGRVRAFKEEDCTLHIYPPVEGIEWKEVDIGHRPCIATDEFGMAYTGPLARDGVSPSDGAEGSIMLSGKNSLDDYKAETCLMLTQAEGGGISYEPIPCPLDTRDRDSLSATRVGDTVYLFGPWVQGRPNTLRAYSIRDKTWRRIRKKGGTPWPAPRRCHSSFCLGGKLYIVGGFDDDFNTHKDMFVFDPKTEVFTELKNPVSVACAAAVVVGKTAHLIGGQNNRHLVYTEKGGIRQLRKMNFEVSSAGAVSVGTNIYLMGGDAHGKQVRVYDTLTKRWSRLADLPIPLWSCRACLISSHTVLLHDYHGTLLGTLPTMPHRDH